MAEDLGDQHVQAIHQATGRPVSDVIGAIVDRDAQATRNGEDQ